MNKMRSLAVGILTAAAGLLFYCGSFYVKSCQENQQAEQMYEEIREAGFVLEPADTRPQKENPVKKDQDLPRQKQKEQSQEEPEESFGISWKKLRRINDDIIAWIEIPGADISYPVVQGQDDTYYLHHSVKKKEDPFGCIFLGAENKKDFQDSHSFLYGHNMEGNLMFANLNRYEEKEFFENCPTICLYTPKMFFEYDIFSVQQAEALSPGFQYGYILGSQAYAAQLEILSENSLYDTGVQTDADSPMLTLVTCNSRLDEKIRMTVHGIQKIAVAAP